MLRIFDTPYLNSFSSFHRSSILINNALSELWIHPMSVTPCKIPNELGPTWPTCTVNSVPDRISRIFFSCFFLPSAVLLQYGPICPFPSISFGSCLGIEMDRIKRTKSGHHEPLVSNEMSHPHNSPKGISYPYGPELLLEAETVVERGSAKAGQDQYVPRCLSSEVIIHRS